MERKLRMNEIRYEADASTDVKFMRMALKLAQKAYNIGETPIGAVIVKNGKVIANGYNLRESRQDITCHAEINAIRKACKKTGSWRLEGCDMYVTLEPCAMCSGAIIQARFKRLIIGTSDTKTGTAGSVVNLFEYGMFNHDMPVDYGTLETECSDMLKQFFREVREGLRPKPGKQKVI
jgi:tRNA(adenine34) deaminase